MKTEQWYHKATSSDQGLVISEQTGETIAVTYKTEHAPMVAAAPELLAALETIAADEPNGTKFDLIRVARAAIAKAKGQACPL